MRYPYIAWRIGLSFLVVVLLPLLSRNPDIHAAENRNPSVFSMLGSEQGYLLIRAAV